MIKARYSAVVDIAACRQAVGDMIGEGDDPVAAQDFPADQPVEQGASFAGMGIGVMDDQESPDSRRVRRALQRQTPDMGHDRHDRLHLVRR